MYFQAHKQTNHSKEDRELFLTLSIDFLESHFNTLFKKVSDSRTIVELKNQHKKYLIQISAYFMEFCRVAFTYSNGSLDYYKLIYGMINVKYILNNIDYIHEIISSKNYPVILKLIPYFKELLSIVHQFANSNNEQRQSVSRNIQKQLLHCKNVLLLIKRVITISKPAMKYFLRITIECNDVLFNLTKKYSTSHGYWHVSSLSCAEIFSRENDSESCEALNMGQESNFTFESLIQHYSSREVVDFYCHALDNCQFESKEFNSMIARFLYFVLKSEKFFKALMRPSIIVSLQKVIAASSCWIQRNQDLVIAAKKVVRKFSSLLISDPSYLVLSFFN